MRKKFILEFIENRYEKANLDENLQYLVARQKLNRL